MHARPVSALEEQARAFESEIVLVNERNGARASARSVLAMVALDARLGDPVRLEIAGPDEAEALAALRVVLASLPELEAVLPVPDERAGEVRVPPGLRDSGAAWWPGQPVSGGVGVGRIVQAAPFALQPDILARRAGSLDDERRAIEQGLDAVLASLGQELGRMPAGIATQILEAHRAVARDPEFRRQLVQRLAATRCNAAQAIVATEAHFADMLQATGSRLLLERVPDIQDVCRRLLTHVCGEEVRPPRIELTQDSIVLADALTPIQFLELNRRFLRGLALRQAGTTSHTVILARSFAIPTIVGLPADTGHHPAGQEGVVDGELGLLVVDLTDQARRYYAREAARLERLGERLHASALRPASTQDGQRLEIGVNISSADEAAPAFAAGAEGVGLFRTEMLYAGCKQPPSEEFQIEQYRKVLDAAAGRPVLIRTLDAGGDKPIPYLNAPHEANPFLGCRGVRLYGAHEELFRTQVRALYRASVAGCLRLLVPMVSCLDEIRWVRRVMSEERRRLEQEGIAHDPGLPLGLMVETPALANSLEDLAQEADLFSVGTNDLLQYYFAAERGNPALSALSDPLHPSFLRLLKRVVDVLHARNKWVGICGEMASSRRYLPLLVGLGADEISLSPPALGALKADLQGLTASRCRDLLSEALACSVAADVAALLDGFEPRAPLPVLTEELVQLDSEARSKAEAIREIADQMNVLGRVDCPAALEEAVWRREATYATSMGDGIAVPHCMNASVRSSTIGLLRLREPVPWGDAGEDPVGLVVLIAIRPAEQALHLRLFSRLARHLMRPAFRRVLQEPKTILGWVNDALEGETLGPAAAVPAVEAAASARTPTD
jgi:fructose-specific PTS system IIA-like component